MVNRWTGAHDAVVELSPGGADRLLAVMHRKGHRTSASTDDGPHLLHSATFNLPLAGAPASGPNLKGHLRVQVSTPSVDAPLSGGPGRVRVSVMTYAWFQAAAGSDPAPEFLHGTLAITVGVRLFKCHGETLAEVQLASDDVVVEFTPAPGSGATAADLALIQAAAPGILRSGIGSAQFAIGALSAGTFSVRDLGFKTLRSGSHSALVLLLSLRAGGGAASPELVKEIFLAAGDDAAVALGREFLTAVLKDVAHDDLDAIEVGASRFIGAFGVGFTVSFNAKVDPDSLALELQDGRVRVRVGGTGSISPGGSFAFRVTQHLGLEVSAGGRLRLVAAGGPELDITQGNAFLKFVLGLVEGLIESRIASALSGVLGAANDQLNRVVEESIGGLMERLSLPGADLKLARALIDPDAVLLGGKFDIGPAPGVVAAFKESVAAGWAGGGAQKELDALESWIPGGTVARYRWRRMALRGEVLQQVDEPHRFVTRVPLAGANPALASVGWPPIAWCVEVSGSQHSGTGIHPVTGSVCGFNVLVVGLDLSSAERLTVTVTDGQGGVLADVDPWGAYRPHAFVDDTEERGYLLVHRPGAAGTASVKVLRAVLAGLGPQGPVVLATVVLENGARDAGLEREAPELAFTRDPEGAWRRRFRLEPGGTVLVGPAGKELWRDAGPLRAELLEKMLAGRRAPPGKRPRLPRQLALGLKVDLGAIAPDVLFPCDGGVIVAARKVRRNELCVCFWTSWSEPSLEELRRLSKTASPGCDDAGREGPVVLCINDGETPEHAAATLKRLGLHVTLVPDPERKLARSYGVSCWPTVVRIDRAGRIADVRLGLAHAEAVAAKG
jgi:hypothetical protein